uniref:Protein YIPF n=1 Tax=Strongyloides papillosus TaxID=174720 RepID=A0A0N5B3T7_STREA
MDNNTTLDFLSFNNPPGDGNFEPSFSENTRNFSSPHRNNTNSPNDGSKKSGSYLDSIQNYFNIDTNMFLNRLYFSIVPLKKSNFILDVIENNPDIYGPLWILLTLVLSIGVTNSLVHFFNTYGEQSTEVDFQMITAVFTLLSLYITLVPLGLYFYMSYNGAATNYTYMEVLCTYGYNLAILVPISVFYHFNFSILRTSLIIVAIIITCTVLYNTFWPAFKNLGKRNEAMMVMVLIIILQIVVVSLLKVYYLDTLSPIKMADDKSSIIFPHTQGSSLVQGINVNENDTLAHSDKQNDEVTTVPQTLTNTVKLAAEATKANIDNKIVVQEEKKEGDKRLANDSTVPSIITPSIALN